MVLKIYVGVPENDRLVTVSSEQTPNQILSTNQVSVSGGAIQHRGRTLSTTQCAQSIDSLGFAENDTLHVVKKLANAR